MGPKKKGGGKKGKKGKSSAKKDPANVLTFNEAVLMHQLELKLAQVNDLKEDIDDLKFRNDRQRQKNDFLTQEQDRQVKNVLEQAHDIAKIEDSKEKVPYQDVENALHLKLTSIRVEEQLVDELNKRISSLEDEIQTHSKSLEEVKHYQEHGQNVDSTHIELLNKEMKDMERSYAEMTEFFDKSLTTAKHDIVKKNADGINQQKKLVSELAIQNLDSSTETEFLDNKWLHKEVDLHRSHIKVVEKEVEILEQHNIGIMADLFDKQMTEVVQTKRFFLACKEAQQKDDLMDEDEPTNTHALVSYNHEDDGGEYEEVIAEHSDDLIDNNNEKDALMLIDDYLTEFDDLPREGDYKLGPMEIKLLCVYGQKMNLQPQDALQENERTDGVKTFTKFTAEANELTMATQKVIWNDD